MNIARLLPSKPVDLPHGAGVEDGNARLVRTLAEEAALPMLRWRVHGTIAGEDVRLFYNLRKRPLAMAPQLFARWEADGRLVGEFRQDRRVALMVFWTGVLFSFGLLAVAARGDLAVHWALLGIAFFAGYPWLAWYMHENHMEKIEELLRRALDATAPAAETPR
jgi:hypothetical protein